MGVEEFYSINGNQMKELFENQTSMKYEDIPRNPTESERNKITSQLTGYISSVCPDELENYKNFKSQ